MLITYEGTRKNNSYGGCLKNRRFANIVYNDDSERECIFSCEMEQTYESLGYKVTNDCGVLMVEVEDKEDYKEVKRLYKEMKEILIKVYPIEFYK